MPIHYFAPFLVPRSWSPGRLERLLLQPTAVAATVSVVATPTLTVPVAKAVGVAEALVVEVVAAAKGPEKAQRSTLFVGGVAVLVLPPYMCISMAKELTPDVSVLQITCDIVCAPEKLV